MLALVVRTRKSYGCYTVVFVRSFRTGTESWIVHGSLPFLCNVLLHLRVRRFTIGLRSQSSALSLCPVWVHCRFGLPHTGPLFFELGILNLCIGHSTSWRTVISRSTRIQTTSIRAHNAIVCSGRIMRAIYEHRGDTCDNALFFVFKAVSKDTGLIPDLQDPHPVCIRLYNLGQLRWRLIIVPFLLECSGECLTTWPSLILSAFRA